MEINNNICPHCSVPQINHGTACGWENAAVSVQDGLVVTPGHPAEGKSFDRWLRSLQLRHVPSEKELANAKAPTPKWPFQSRVGMWLISCFGEAIANDKIERNFRFLEEALELVQANGCTVEDAHALVDYVFDRPVGELKQECGGVMITLASLAHACGISMIECGEIELARVWDKKEAIRAKQAAKKIKSGPLP